MTAVYITEGVCCRLVVTAVGFEGRLVHAAQELIHMHQRTAGGASLQRQVPSLGERMCIFTPMTLNVAWLFGFGDVVLGVFADDCRAISHHVTETGCGNWS